jgi:hypothetical protein
MEMVAQMLKRAEKWMWRPERVVLVVGCGGVAGCSMAGVEGVVPAVSPTEDVGRLHPVG